MQLLWKSTLTLILSSLMLSFAWAWSIGNKDRTSGPIVHVSYFLTPNNAQVPVHARAYVGTFLNGSCQYTAIYNIGNEQLKTGNMIYIDGFSLKSVIGSNYNCMSIYYIYKQLVIETFQLINDGINYQASLPQTASVTIL